MRIEQVMTKAPRTCRPGQSLSQAAQMMWNGDCGCLPVTADDGSQRLLGMITDRDICMAIRLEGSDLRELRVEDAMTEGARLQSGDPVSEAIAILVEERVRRLPVVDDSERVIGLLSLPISPSRRRSRWPGMTRARHGRDRRLLAAICQPPL
jgi:CBS domain-containing protein